MGYDMYQINQRFKIAAGNKEEAFQALKGWEKREIEQNNSLVEFGCPPLGDAETLEEALRELCWEPETDEEGNVVELYFTGDRLSDEDNWLNVLAPYVAKGSYLTMEGEDCYAWRWYFDGETCKEYGGKLTFPGCPTEGDSHG